MVTERLAKKWAVNDIDRLPKDIDLIALVSMGARRSGGLSYGAGMTLNYALILQEFKYSGVPIVFGRFGGNGDALSEETEKTERISNGKFAGSVMSTIKECLAFKAMYPDAKKVVFVTEEAHSRRAKIIWQCLWPEAEIYILSVPLEDAVDEDAIMWLYRRAWTALLFQAGPTPAYKIAAMIGPKALCILGGFHQMVSAK